MTENVTEDLQIFLNGEPRNIDSLELLVILKSVDVTMDSKGVAVAVNDKLVRKADWKSCILKNGERVEVITAAQGG